MNVNMKPSRIGRFHFEPYLVVVVFSLLLIGYVIVGSASLHKSGDAFNYLRKQTLNIGIGLAAGYFVTRVPIRFWEKYGQGLFLLGLLLLIIVIVPGIGIKVNGSTRWLALGGFRFQVSEIVKYFSVIYMAGYVTRHQKTISDSAFSLIKPIGLFGIACFLLLLEPDFGSAVVILTIAMGIMYLAGARIIQFTTILGILSFLASVLVYIAPYRMKRVTSFLNPWADAKDTGYQLVHALISFGRGEWVGVGLGSGIEKLFYLPEGHTDFLFSVIAEELGLLGVLTIISLFAVFVWRTFLIAEAAEQIGEKFSAYIAYGLGIWFGFQASVNMGVNMGILPTKGLTLPLMSYGGGSMLIMCCAVALLLRVNSEVQEIKANKPKERSKWVAV